jgi:signal transduction histidine kinase
MLPTHLADALREVNVSLPVSRHAVLIVDDEQENLEVLQEVLADRWESHATQNGEEALLYLASNPQVGLVIADQRMPHMSGVDLLGRMAVERPDTIRILVTAYSDVEPMLEAINRGSVYRFLLKPYEPEELRAAVEDGFRVRDSLLELRHLVQVLGERRAVLEGTLRQLSETQEQLLAAERTSTMGRAASGIVHDLRNLGTIMTVLMDDIQRDTGDHGLIGSARATLEGLASLIQVLESVRDFARASDAEVKRAPADIRLVLQRAVALAALQQGGRACRVQIEVDPEVRVLAIDQDRVHQAIVALVDNAMRASTPDQLVQLTVRPLEHLGAYPAPGANLSPGWARIDVVDRGCGMDEDMLSRAMESLFSGFTPPRLGLGLGLVRLTAQAHGGRLELESAVGQGTRATLLMPVRSGTC